MLDPRTRLILVFYAGLLAVALEGPGALGLLVLMALLPLFFIGLEGKWLKRGLYAILAVIWSTALSQGLFYAQEPRVPLICAGPLCLYREGIFYGLAQSLRFVALSLAGLGLTLSTPPDRLYGALMALRIPFALALMAATSLRFIPEVGRELLIVRRARAHRGRPVHKRLFWRWALLEVELMRPVVARAWRRAHNLAESLDARGFDAQAPRAVRRPLQFRGVDYLVLISGGLFTLGILFSRLLYLLYTSESYYHPALRNIYGFVRHYL